MSSLIALLRAVGYYLVLAALWICYGSWNCIHGARSLLQRLRRISESTAFGMMVAGLFIALSSFPLYLVHAARAFS